MRKLWTLALIAVAGLAIPITFVGCDRAEGPLEEAGEEAGQAVEDAGEAAGQAVEDAGDAVEQAVEDAGDAVEQATDPS